MMKLVKIDGMWHFTTNTNPQLGMPMYEGSFEGVLRPLIAREHIQDVSYKRQGKEITPKEIKELIDDTDENIDDLEISVDTRLDIVTLSKFGKMLAGTNPKPKTKRR